MTVYTGYTGGQSPISHDPGIVLTKVDASGLPGWSETEHRGFVEAFQSSLGMLKAHLGAGPGDTLAVWSPVLDAFGQCDPQRLTDLEIVTLIAGMLDYWEIVASPEHAEELVFTGFYEPVVDASRTRTAAHAAPLYCRPADLVALTDDHLRGGLGDQLTYARASDRGPVPYWTRAEIAGGALQNRGLELAYVSDEVDAFLLQVQGSGLLRFDDGTERRITYDGKNGHPYASIGKWLIGEGHIDAADMTMDLMLAWLRTCPPDQQSSILALNPSFVFFSASPECDSAAQGAAGVGLVAGRSLAVDASLYPLGAPFYVAPDPVAGLPPRSMVAHDVGSAIRGPRRGDIFAGTGDVAGRTAGRLRHSGRIFVAVPAGAPIDIALPNLKSGSARA